MVDRLIIDRRQHVLSFLLIAVIKEPPRRLWDPEDDYDDPEREDDLEGERPPPRERTADEAESEIPPVRKSYSDTDKHDFGGDKAASL